MTLASPLHWPAGWKRHPYRGRSPFRVTLAKARDDLYIELERFGTTSVIISSNAKLNLDGTIAARQHWISDPGVVVYFTRNGREMCIPCDAYETIDANLRAIGLTIAAIRGIERHGTSQMMEAAFSGFTALPETTSRPWATVLGVQPDASREVIDAAYRALVKRHHPDVGGDPARLREINEAHQQSQRGRS